MADLFRVLVLCLAALISLGLASPAAAEGQSRSIFVFGNSLVDHQSDDPMTAVAPWMALMAEADGNSLSLDGTFGFLRNFAVELPPEAKWSYPGVTPAWDTDRYAFRRADLDTIIVTPANFIQYQPADRPYDGDNPQGFSPLSATLRLLDWASNQQPDAAFYIYEGWAEMAGITGYPPRARGLRRYHAANAGDYHDWYVDYVAQLRAAEPDLRISLIPVASVLAAVFEDTALADLAATDLYVDDAPHGTADLYLLAAAVTYATLYDTPPPAALALPDTVSPVIRDAWPDVSARIWQALGGTSLPRAAVEAPATGLTDPALAMGLNGIADWSAQQPFIDVMKSARPWVGHTPEQWGVWDMARLTLGGYVGPEGWPLALPDGVTALESFLLTDQSPDATSLSGRYIVRWQGGGALTVGGIARDVTRDSDNQISFTYSPGEGPVSLRIESLAPGDPIRAITVVREDRVALHEVGALFNPDWIALIRDLRSVRFMDWMMTNGSEQDTWADRPAPSDATYAWRGVPVEVMVTLANEIGVDPWFTLPHRADDAYVRAFATYVHENLDPRLKTYVEWSNEVWNFIFPQAIWATEQATARWGETPDGWMQFAGLRAAEVADIWTQVYGPDAPDRLIRTVATHTGYPGPEEALLDAPLAQAEGLSPPSRSFDAYAVTGYFGFELGDDAMADRLRGWIAAGTAAEDAAAALRDGSFNELTTDLWPYHAAVARDRGFALVMYEGGTHVAGHGAQLDDDALTAFYTDFNYSPAMAALYADLLTRWQDIAGTPFNAFVDVATPTRFGSWGTLRHLDDRNPRWDTLMAYNAVPTGLSRAPGTFAQGFLIQGTNADDTLTGTTEEDTLIGGPGDDTLIANGGSDRLHGGDGQDRAVLPGYEVDYILTQDGDTILARTPNETTRLFSIEALEFTAAPGLIRPIAEVLGAQP